MRALTDWADAHAAWKHVVRSAQDRGIVSDLRACIARFSAEEHAPKALPGFDLLGPQGDKAYDWCVVSARSPDTDEFYGDYLDFVGARKESTAKRRKFAKRIVTERRSTTYFGKELRKNYAKQLWWVEGVQVTLAAHKKFGGELTVKGSTVLLDLDAFKVGMSARGPWNPLQNSWQCERYSAYDADPELLRMPPLVTAHPLALALLKLKVPDHALWAGAWVIRAEGRGEPIDMALLKEREIPVALRRQGLGDLSERLANAEVILSSPTGITIKEAYEAVKGLMPLAVFTRRMGSPFTVRNRVLGARARRTLLSLLIGAY